MVFGNFATLTVTTAIAVATLSRHERRAWYLLMAYHDAEI
jgi:hypothetical protein